MNWLLVHSSRPRRKLEGRLRDLARADAVLAEAPVPGYIFIGAPTITTALIEAIYSASGLSGGVVGGERATVFSDTEVENLLKVEPQPAQDLLVRLRSGPPGPTTQPLNPEIARTVKKVMARRRMVFGMATALLVLLIALMLKLGAG